MAVSKKSLIERMAEAKNRWILRRAIARIIRAERTGVSLTPLHAEFALEAASTLGIADAERARRLERERAHADAMRRRYTEVRATQARVEAMRGPASVLTLYGNVEEARARADLFESYRPFLSDATLHVVLDRVVAACRQQADEGRRRAPGTGETDAMRRRAGHDAWARTQ